MPPARHLPFWILALILASAAAVLVLGFRVSREHRVVTIEQDRAPLSRFTGELIAEMNSLEVLYVDQLLAARDRIGDGSNGVLASAILREIVATSQLTIAREGEDLSIIDLRENDRNIALPEPRRLDERKRGDGLVVDPIKLRAATFENGWAWIEEAGHPPHFVAPLDYRTMFIVRIDPGEAASAAGHWLSAWLPEAYAPVIASGISTSVQNPAGEILVATGAEAAGASDNPNFILPITSRFGDWKVQSWARTEAVVDHNLPVMMGAASLAVVLVLAGVFGFAQQWRALRLAGQRVSFVNQVSHELRTPMMNILLNVDLLADSARNDEARRTKRLGLIREEAGRLSRLLENVLSFSRREKLRAGEAGGDLQQDLRIESCSPGELVDNVLAQFADPLARKDIEVVRHDDTACTDAQVIADPDAFAQILSNLISNVEKYAAAGGLCEIRTTVDAAAGEVAIAVSDRGPGISRSDIAQVFRPFARLNEATSEGVSGTGLGLAIARDLAESMHGRLEIADRQDRDATGACFVLTLPMAAGNVVRMAS